MTSGAADTMPESPDKPVVKSTVEARQGEAGRDISGVLFISVGGAAVLLAIAYFYFFG